MEKITETKGTTNRMFGNFCSRTFCVLPSLIHNYKFFKGKSHLILTAKYFGCPLT